jgi:pimeloyl-ACP methyl ester carboxylesterase
MSANTDVRRLETFRRSGLSFDVVDAGPITGEAVVMLHGWPGGAETWTDVARELTGLGRRVLTFDQRGYAPGARPTTVRSYGIPQLVDDVLALLDAAELEQAHIVGHDWGGAVAWALASRAPSRVASLVVLSTPHPAAMARALRSSDQPLRSAYVAAFQLRWLPERVLLARRGRVLRELLRRSGLDDEHVDLYVGRQLEPGALTAALAWYRALPFAAATTVREIEVPTLYVWSSADAALGRAAAEATGDHVSGPYRFEVLDGLSHWLPETAPGLVSRLVSAHVERHPSVPAPVDGRVGL